MQVSGLIPWRKHEPLDRFRREMDRMFDRVFEGASTLGGREVLTVGPDVDLYETDKEYWASFELPGIDDKEVDVTVSDNTLLVRGEKKPLSKEDKSIRYLFRGCEYGLFERSVTLPAQVDANKVRARYRKGILEITLPKSESAMTKSIKVELAEK